MEDPVKIADRACHTATDFRRDRLATETAPVRAPEERFHRALKDASTGYFLVDTEGCFRWVNDAWLRLHGYSSLDEVIGRHFSITQPDGDLEKAQAVVRELLAGAPVPEGEFSRKRKDGSLGYHTFSAHSVIEGERVVGLEGFLIDTTRFHDSEER